MLFKAASVKNIESIDINEDELNNLLEQMKYKPASPNSEMAIGWISPFGDDSNLLYLANQKAYLLSILIEKKTVPSSLINREVEKIIHEEKTKDPEFCVGKRDLEILKTEVKTKLLPNIPSNFTTINVYIDTALKVLIVGTSSDKVDELALSLLHKTIPNFKASFIPVDDGVADEMKNWIIDLDLPESFSLGNACKLRDPVAKSVIKYNKYELDDESIICYLKNGMEITDISMVWDDQLSFSMNQTLTLSGIKSNTLETLKEELLDGIENITKAVIVDAEFNVTVSLLRRFIPDYIKIFENLE